jgi:5,10-methenyltetrahydromethanopterin hydrogenase
VNVLKSIVAAYPHKTWHVPAILPEELGRVYVSAGFVREELSQWQMTLKLSKEHI